MTFWKNIAAAKQQTVLLSWPKWAEIVWRDIYIPIHKILYRKKWEFYSGKDETPFPLKILKQDISIYLDSDEELIEAKNKLEYYRDILSFLEGVLKSLNNRGFQIKNAIDWKKFTEGLN